MRDWHPRLRQANSYRVATLAHDAIFELFANDLMRKSTTSITVNRAFRTILILVVAGTTGASALEANAQARAMRMGPRLQMLLQEF